MRKQQQTYEAKPAAQPRCSLFSNCETTPQKVHRIAKAQTAPMREHPKSIALAVKVGDDTHDVD
eukprot:7827356-Pyramimonas_sp.AAC.1